MPLRFVVKVLTKAPFNFIELIHTLNHLKMSHIKGSYFKVN